MIRTSSFLTVGPVLGVTLALGACGSATSPQQGLTTASILGEAPAAAGGDTAGVSNSDPLARPVQVAWTAARAQKCGFQFDAARLKTNYLTSEAR